MAAELVKPSDINFMVTHARGLVCLSLTRERCRQLGLPPMVRDNTSPHGTNFTVSIEAAEGVTTGISAYDRAHTVRTAVRPDAKPQDLSQPGHIFPLQAQPGGVLNRAGHTEAASDLALLAGFEPAGVLVGDPQPDGSMARRAQLEDFAREHGLKIGSIEDLIRHRLATEHTIERVDERTVETAHGPFLLRTYRDRIGHGLHFALLRGEADASAPTLVRVHMQNVLSDALHWRRADFGPATDEVLAAIAREGRTRWSCSARSPASRRCSRACTRRTPRRRRRPRRGALADWRRNGAGSQILAELGLGKLRVIGTRAARSGSAASASRSWNTSNCRRAETGGPPRRPRPCRITKATCVPATARASRSSPAAGTRASPMRWSPARARPSPTTAWPRAWSTWCACPAPGNCRWPRQARRRAFARGHRRARLRRSRRHPPLRTGRGRLRRRADAVALDHGVPVANGVLAVEVHEDAENAPAAAMATRARKPRWWRSRWRTCWSDWHEPAPPPLMASIRCCADARRRAPQAIYAWQVAGGDARR